MDDVITDKIAKNPEMESLFKRGSRHWNQLVFVGTQFAYDLPPKVRTSVSFAVIFATTNNDSREKLYKNFGGGIFSNKDEFNKVLDACTGDYKCMVIDMQSTSNKLEDRVFYSKSPQPPESWKFGCAEYHRWAEKRYNTNYVDPIPGF